MVWFVFSIPVRGEAWKAFAGRRGKPFPLISLKRDLPNAEDDPCSVARFPGHGALVRAERWEAAWRLQDPLSRIGSFGGRVLSRGVGTAPGSGAEGRETPCRVPLGSTGSPSPQRVCAPALFAEELRANVFWSESGQIRQHFGRVVSTAAGICPKFTLPHYRDEQFINGEPPMRARLEDVVGACCGGEDSQEGVGGDVFSVCLAWGSESQGFQRAHRFLGSTQHLAGSGLRARCREPY